MLPWTYLNPDSHELILVLMIVTISLITKQNPLFVWASDNRVPRHWSMINLPFCTCCAPRNSGRGLLILSSLLCLPKGTVGLVPHDSGHSPGMQPVGTISKTPVILIISCHFFPLSSHFFFTLLPLNNFKYLTFSTSTSPCKFNHIQDVSLEEITNKLISRILFFSLTWFYT